jgi:predicted RNA-binding Zn-ribbon protein involved in translation (DUF1610 family)
VLGIYPAFERRLCTAQRLLSKYAIVILKGNSSMTSIATAVVFCCKNCGAGYRAVQRQQVQSETSSGRFDCQVCGSQIVVWSDAYEYVDWKPVETVRVPGINDGPRRPRLRY